MTRFEDGPAKGHTLMLQRAPRFLRVTVDDAGAVDALDLWEDTPRADETLHAYELVRVPGRCHVNRGRKGSGWYTMADYKLVTAQPSDAIMRSFDTWKAWTENQEVEELE